MWNELREHFPPAARTASYHAQRPGRSTKAGRLFAVTCCSTPPSLIHHSSVYSNTLNVFFCVQTGETFKGCFVERELTRLKSSLSHSGYFWQQFVMDLLSLHSRMRR